MKAMHPDYFFHFHLITDPPEIDVEGSWIHSGEGQEAVLACVVHADPPATVKDFFFLLSFSQKLVRGSVFYYQKDETE